MSVTSDEASTNPSQVKLDLSLLEAQPDGASATLVGVSVKLVERCEFVKKLTQEVNNTRLGLVANSAIVEPQLDVS